VSNKSAEWKLQTKVVKREMLGVRTAGGEKKPQERAPSSNNENNLGGGGETIAKRWGASKVERFSIMLRGTQGKVASKEKGKRKR